jgi:solute carrier family 5 (sodium-coupled monocarboxylate transporter), member 8/12
MADKNMSIIPVAFSLMASFMSAVTLLGVSMENYSYGTQFVMINISYGIATPIAAYGYLPVFYELQATSAYEVIRQYFFVFDHIPKYDFSSI